MTPTYCIQCESGYFYDVGQAACLKESLISQEGKATLIALIAILGGIFLIRGMHKILERLQIINKKIDPRRIRAFPKTK